MKMIRGKKWYLFVFFTNLWSFVFAQISEKEVFQMLKEASMKGRNKQEMGVMLMEKGVSLEQVKQIMDEYRLKYEMPDSIFNENEREREQNTTYNPPKGEPQIQVASIFGHEIFNNERLTFEPNFNIATPKNYILGPGDEVIVDIWGDAEQTFSQKISPEGTIIDAKIGPVYLNGLSISEATERLRNHFARIYSTMLGNQPTTFMTLSLGKIRSIRVNVMGEVKLPGTYTLPSLASLFHAIYCAGGVNEIGSLRSIKINRAGKTFACVDVYDYLLNGKTDLNIRLQDDDVIIVTPYQNLITLRGKVKRPLVYELRNNETMAQLLSFSGGFTGDAHQGVVRVIRKSDGEFQVYNVEDVDFDTFVLTDGDEVAVDAVIDRFRNRVEIGGAVFRSGLYDLEQTATVKQLIQKAEGVRGDAFLDRAVLYREKPDLTQEIVAVDVRKIMNGQMEDFSLQNNDVLYIPSIFDLKEAYTIKISGAVGSPGVYPFVEGMNIEDFIIRAGGLKEAASEVKIDVARRIKNPKSIVDQEKIAENYVLTLKEGLVIDGLQGFELQPFDEIYVRRSPGYQEQQNVYITGEILFGGEYVLSKKGERLSDLVKKAGGLTSDAYVVGARLVRKINEDERNRIRSVLQLTKRNSLDSIALDQLNMTHEYDVGIDLEKALKHPGSEYDVVLREGDALRIPTYTGIVKISGAVMYNNSVVYNGNSKLKYYIEQGGGFANRAKRRKVFIVYMNGQVARNKLFAKAKVAPGCEIIVPQKPLKKGLELVQAMSLATSTASIAALITSIISNTK